MSIHNCFISGLVERNIFDLKSSSFRTKIDDVCPICLIDLNKTGEYGCCGKYARKLKKCGHWVHVGCQIDKNPNRHQCSVCRTVIIDKDALDYKIKINKLVNILPIHYQSIIHKNGVEALCINKKYKDDLIKNYGFNELYFIELFVLSITH